MKRSTHTSGFRASAEGFRSNPRGTGHNYHPTNMLIKSGSDRPASVQDRRSINSKSGKTGKTEFTKEDAVSLLNEMLRSGRDPSVKSSDNDNKSHKSSEKLDQS